MGSIDDNTIDMIRMSFDERAPKKVSLMKIKTKVNKQIVIIVEITPKKMIKPMF